MVKRILVNLGYKDLSAEAIKNIQSAKEKAIGKILKKIAKLTQEQKDY